jgi:hypothetical protein
MEELDASLETRLSVAGAASSAVQQMNDNERNAFQSSCYQKRQEALNAIAWDFRTVIIPVAIYPCSLNYVCLHVERRFSLYSSCARNNWS